MGTSLLSRYQPFCNSKERIMKTTYLLAATLFVSFAFVQAPTAVAADIVVKCEKRANRSKISVDGGDLPPGEYRARVISGDNKRVSLPQSTIGDEVEFDFDSRLADINAGATEIPSSFIQNGAVTGKIINSAGRVVISDTELCRVR